MRFSARTWSLVSLLLFVAAVLCWRKGNEIEARKRLLQAPPTATNTVPKPGAGPVFEPASTRGTQLASLKSEPITSSSLQNGVLTEEQLRKRFPYRLHNTEKSLNELVKDDNAVLLANALIDTRGALPEIPEHLRATSDPGSYIVQWKNAASAEFRALISDAGAQIISYVPNNAYYVKVDKSGADRLAATPGVQSVMPFEPYYKLDQALLRVAVEKESLPSESILRLTLLPGTDADASVAQEVRRLGGEVIGKEKSPFGPQLIIRPALDSLVALAQLGEVQGIERSAQRKPASDLTRVTLGISADGETNANYLGLTGAGSLVNVNDTGIQPDHPALADTTIHLPSGPLGPLLVAGDDTNGHGTFVASLIAGNGAGSPAALKTNTIPGSGTNTNTTEIVINVLPGSTGNPSLRGMAPDADLLVLPLDPTGSFADVSTASVDSWLIESAAQTNYTLLRRTNSLISNNSWTYGIPSYDSSAARFDAAVRDSLPGTANEQPLLFVFAAGNSGFGDENGSGGSLDTIESPGTAKNVITVGALETLRLITNLTITNVTIEIFTNSDGTLLTNRSEEIIFPFAAMTDSSSEVASFSSRGNVGIGIEGDAGRFKPDVVAPGTMLVAARSAGYTFSDIDTNSELGKLFLDLSTNLATYRYDSGSTFAAANVSGFLALVQEYFRDHGPVSVRSSLSPALMKALLINGARPIGNYDLAVRSAGNFQGWGLPNLPNSLASFSTNDQTAADISTVRLRMFEQHATNAVVTGQSRTWNVTLSTNASTFPLRMTLVWTDPPGNPAVGVKLVNDLDLVVTNLDTGAPIVFYGNNFAFGGDVSEPVQPVEGVAEPVDRINNVENIVIRDPGVFGRNFSVTVRGRRVNVNSVNNYLSATGSTNDVAQDFALVVSSDMGADPALNDPLDPAGYLPSQPVFEEFQRVAQPNIEPRASLINVTNGLPILEQRVGANPSLIGTNGTFAQWNFYVFTNLTTTNDLVSLKAGSNVAFVTFNPPNLSRPRTVEADIDLYVSTDPRLTNLTTSVVASAFKSRERGGIESVVFTNATLGTVYYIGVKSEDQQAAEYSFMGVSTDRPFEEERNGRRVLLGVPLTAAVLDGTARKPTAGTVIAIGISNRRVANVSVETTIFHENLPDLVGVLSHNQTRVILNNHTFGTNIANPTFGTNSFYYNDNSFFPPPAGVVAQQTDGPGSLNDFAGLKLIGPWFLEMIDNTPSHTGRVDLLTVYVDPLKDPIPYGQFVADAVDPNQVNFYPVDVPPAATNLTFSFRNMSGGQLQFYFREGKLPTTNEFDFTRIINAPGAVFSLPVIGGSTYFVGLRNTTGARITFEWRIDPGLADPSANRYFQRSEIPDVPEVATSSDILDVNIDKLVADVQVGVRMNHPRTADIVLSLISPQGTRVLLAENRGYTNGAGFGSMTVLTNGFSNSIPILSTQANYVIFTEHTNATVPVKFANPGGGITLGTIGVPFANDFEGSVLAGNYRVGTALAGGWTVIDSSFDTNTPSQISIINGLGLARTGDTLVSLGTAGLRRRFPITAGRTYTLRFAARAGKLLDLFSTGVNDAKGPLDATAVDPHYFLLQGDQTAFPGPNAFVLDPGEPPFVSGQWLANSARSQWIAPYDLVPTTDGTGIYAFRTYIDMYEQDTRAAIFPAFQWAADDRGSIVRLNGVPLPYPSGSPTNLSGVYTLGGLIPGLNVLDFFVTDTNGVEGLRVESLNGVSPVKGAASVNVSVGGTTRIFPVAGAWQNFEMDFNPTNSLETLEIVTRSGEVWLDSVSVETSGDIFVQPEESFDAFDGERAMGEWRLEVRDARTGAVLPTEDVLEWSLDLTLAETPNKARLVQSDILGPFTILTNQVHYIILDPCRSATFARLTLRGVGNFDEIEMRADWSGFPSGNSDLEDFAPVRNNQNPGQANGELVFEINRNLPAPAALRGKPLYLAIYNRFQVATNRYELDFVADGDCTPITPPPIIQPGGAPTQGTVPPDTGTGTTNSTSGLFQFDVGPNIRSATVTVVSDGDVSVYALKDEPPTKSLFTYFVDNVNAGGTESLVVNDPFGGPLTPGTYFVRIVNDITVPVNYSVSVRYDTIAAPGVFNLFVFIQVDGKIQLQVQNAEAGVNYEILGSTSILGPWTAIATVPGNNPRTTVDPATTGFNFFIVRQAP